MTINLNIINLFNDFIVNELKKSLGVLFGITGANAINLTAVLHCLGCFGGLKEIWRKKNRKMDEVIKNF